MVLADAVLSRVVAHILGDFHRTEVRAAHRAEVRQFVGVLGQGLVVELLGFLRIQTEMELVVPAELEARLAQGVIAHLRTGMALGEVGRMRGDLVGHDPIAHILALGQAQVFLGVT